jgi:hypothetical protein
MKRLPSVHNRFGIKPEPLAAQAICDGVLEFETKLAK